MELPLKITWKLQLVQEVIMNAIQEIPQVACVTLLLHKLHWLPVSFQMQFKVLVITFKLSSYGMEPCYLWNHLILKISTPLIRLDRISFLPSFKCCYLVGYRKQLFSVPASTMWNCFPLEIQKFILLAFWKVKIGFSMRLGSGREVSSSFVVL